jgi:long-chain acyl-CoA synthetase
MLYPNLGEMLYEKALKLKNKKCLIFENKVYTYSQVNKISNKIARILIDQGIKKGDRVGILLENSPEFIFSFFAITKCGAVAVPLNIFLKKDEIKYILNDCEANYLITATGFESSVENLQNEVGSLQSIFAYEETNFASLNLEKLQHNVSDENINEEIEKEDLAVLIYTSGTTGNPKGAMLTHKNLLSNCDGCFDAFKIKSKDRFLLFLPMFHSYAFTTCVLLPLFSSASIIILRSVMEIKKKSFKKILIYKRPTFFLGVPQVYSALSKAKMPTWFIKFLYPVRLHVSGGAPLSEETLNNFKEKFKKPIIEGYGLSEASPVVSVNRLNRQKPYSVGLPLKDIEVKVVNEDELEVPIGEVGELIIKGPNVMKGYWKMKYATDETIKNGWLFTGDLVKVDEEGFIYIVDRKKDLIIVKGINVYPREIEELLYQHNKVEAAAVIGIKDSASGEVPVAYIMPKEGEKIEENELKNYLKEHLANFKIPRQFHIVEELPMTATGKVLKRMLKENIASKEKNKE